MALYVYGLMRADDVRGGLDLGPAERLPPVEVLVRERLAALVGEVAGESVRLQRDALMGHSEVLQRAFEQGPVLPFRFGTVVADEEQLDRDLLSSQRSQWVTRLEALAGKGEFQLKVTYHEESMLRSIVKDDPALSRTSQAVRGMSPAASHFQRIGMGERVNAAVEVRRAQDAQALLAELEPLVLMVEVGALQQPMMVLNASFLVASESFDRFDSAVEGLAQQRHALMAFKLIGPMPAHSFADRDLPTAAAAGRS